MQHAKNLKRIKKETKKRNFFFQDKVTEDKAFLHSKNLLQLVKKKHPQTYRFKREIAALD